MAIHNSTNSDVSNNEIHFDIIIAGAGCAGLSLIMHLIHSGNFGKKRILLVDKDSKQSNDRTWCYWEEGSGLFESVVAQSWKELAFYSDSYSDSLDIGSYRYKMIRGADFYEYCLKVIKEHPNITVRFGEIKKVFSSKASSGIILNDEVLFGHWIFNSILFEKPLLSKNEYWMLQHFKGWMIETKKPVFDESKATLMDFRVEQNEGTTFCYVLPLSSSKALVEYTLFSSDLLDPSLYDAGLKNYINQFITDSGYDVIEEEFGVIPMTNYKFSKGHDRLINIGTAGGQTKGSSGYTFSFIQKHCKEIVRQLEISGSPLINHPKGRFLFYDSILLHILVNNKLPGKTIFEMLFKRNRASQVLKFLDNETSPAEELRIIMSLPWLPFTKAAIQHFL